MQPVALLGFWAALRAADCKQAEDVESSSLLQVSNSGGLMSASSGQFWWDRHHQGRCPSAYQFSVAAIEAATECKEEWKGQEGTKCQMALCNMQKTEDAEDVREEDAAVMRAMCKRGARSRRWGPPPGWICPTPGSSSGDPIKDNFCNRMDTVCDAWAIHFVHADQRSKLQGKFAIFNEYLFADGPGCTHYDYAFEGFREELPSISDYLAQSSNFDWKKIDGIQGCNKNREKIYGYRRNKDITLDLCLHACERIFDCGAANFVLTKNNGEGKCDLRREPCHSEGLQSYKLDRGTALVQTSNASDSKIEEAAEPLLAELARRSLKTGSSDGVVDQHLESTVLRKCAEPCN